MDFSLNLINLFHFLLYDSAFILLFEKYFKKTGIPLLSCTNSTVIVPAKCCEFLVLVIHVVGSNPKKKFVIEI
jgi:hypothetical protein